MKPSFTLHSRLILSHLLVSLISIALVAAFAGNSILTRARVEVTHGLESVAFAAAKSLEFPLQQYQEGEVEADFVRASLRRMFADQPGLEFTVYNIDGTPIISSGEELPPQANEASAPEVIDALENELGTASAIRRNAQGVEILYSATFIQQGNQITGVLQVGTPLQPALAGARRSLGFLLLVALLVASAASLFGWMFANNLARPIQELTRAAENLAQGDLGERVRPSGTEEMQRLALTFNTMAARLQAHVDELRTFVANASHELRTPLTVVKLRTEALRDGALEDPPVAERFLSEIESEVDRLVRMVNDLLDLSRIEAGLHASPRVPIHLGVIAREVYETFIIRAQRAGIDLALEVDPTTLPVIGSEDQLRRVLDNFVENAIKYTPTGGKVKIAITSLDSGKKGVRLEVSDTGPGISPEHLPHLFERFFRIESTRPRVGPAKGSGLGLAIAKSIIENHGGEIGVSSNVGEGSTFWATLPAAEG